MIKYFIIVFICFSCTQKKNKALLEIEPQCPRQISFINLIKRTINADNELYQINLEDVGGKTEIVTILKNKYFTDSINLNEINDKPVNIISAKTLDDQKIINYLEFQEINFKGDSADVTIRYNACKWYLIVTLIKKECDWDIIKASIIET